MVKCNKTIGAHRLTIRSSGQSASCAVRLPLTFVVSRLMPLATIPAHLGQVVVRYLATSDHQGYIALERDAEVRKFVNGPSTKTDDDFLYGFRNYKPTTSLLVIADAITDSFLGRCGLLPVLGTNEVELFLLLAKSCQRKGIGQTVLQFMLALAHSQGKKPIGIVHPDNVASRALMEKIGMVLVGTISSTNYQNGHLRYEPMSDRGHR